MQMNVSLSKETFKNRHGRMLKTTSRFLTGQLTSHAKQCPLLSVNVMGF